MVKHPDQPTHRVEISPRTSAGLRSVGAQCLSLLALIGAAADEVRLGVRTMEVTELRQLVRCWYLLAGEDTPAERVVAALDDEQD